MQPPHLLMLAVLPEAIWRGRAATHAERTSRLLAPGMMPPQKEGAGYRLSTEHPVTNFLEEYELRPPWLKY